MCHNKAHGRIISDPEDHERDSVAFISREKAHALGEYLLNM